MRGLAALSMALASVMLLTSCSLINSLLDRGPDAGQVVRESMARIIEAINDQDAVALRALFTDYARAEYSEDIDAGVAHLLSLFPNGDVIWRDSGQPAGSGSGVLDHGKKTWLSGMSEIVSSAGAEYTLSFSIFTENTVDPDNVGVFQIGAVPHTASEDSGLELAFAAWPGPDSSDARAGGPPGVFFGDSGGLSRDRAQQIIDALNAQDAHALKAMFTTYALAEHSADIDAGLDYLLSLFANGDVVWQKDQGGSGVYERVDGDKRAVLLPTFYTVNTGGVDYRLFFADFIENSIDPDNVGIYAIGAVPAAECRQCVPEADIYDWASSFGADATGHPGIFMPPEHTADARMSQIASAVNSHDAAALKGMFSPYALAQTSEIDAGLDYFLSFFPNGELTWTRDTDDTLPVNSYSQIEAGELQEWVLADYKVSVEGEDYRLHFSEVTADEIDDRDNTGLNKLGITPWTEDPVNGCNGLFADSWSCSVFPDETGDNGYPVIYVPQ